MDDKWILDNGIYFPISGDSVIHTSPGSGIFELVKDSDPRSGRLGLHKLSDSFDFEFKIYETGGSESINRVYTLWNNEEFQKTKKNLGIIFNGTKGTGKTICAKLLCNKIGLPVIIVNHSYDGAILDFIPRLSFEATVLVDEAEKTFCSDEDSHILLKLIDGVYNRTRKLYILTTNSLVINDNLLGRPGRIRYIQEFKNLSKEVVDEYINDNLKDLSRKEEVFNLVDSLSISTIDILRSIIEEVNLLGELGDGNNILLNVPRNAYTFDVVIFRNFGSEDISKIRDIIKKNKPSNIPLDTWFKTNQKVDTDSDGNDIRVRDLFYDDDNNKFCCITSFSSVSSVLYNGCSTSIGDVLSDPSEDGFILMDTEELYPVLILGKRKTLSIYNNNCL